MVESATLKNFNIKHEIISNPKTEIAKSLVNIENETKQLLSDISDLRSEIDVLLQMLYPEICGEDFLDKFAYFRRLRSCSVIDLESYLVNERDYTELMYVDEIEISEEKKEKLVEAVAQRSNDYQKVGQEFNEKSFDELAFDTLRRFKKKRIILNEIVSDFENLHDLKLLVGICLLHHFKKVYLDFNYDTDSWEVILNEL